MINTPSVLRRRSFVIQYLVADYVIATASLRDINHLATERFGCVLQHDIHDGLIAAVGRILDEHGWEGNRFFNESSGAVIDVGKRWRPFDRSGNIEEATDAYINAAINLEVARGCRMRSFREGVALELLVKLPFGCQLGSEPADALVARMQDAGWKACWQTSDAIRIIC